MIKTSLTVLVIPGKNVVIILNRLTLIKLKSDSSVNFFFLGSSVITKTCYLLHLSFEEEEELALVEGGGERMGKI